MKDTKNTIAAVLDQVSAADLTPIREFLLGNPSEPLVAIGSGGAAAAADLLALLYGARGGVSTAVTPYTLNSFSDAALKTGKVVLLSKGGHNNDVVFATSRALEVNPSKTAAINLYDGDRNDARKLFVKAGSPLSFTVPVRGTNDGFVSLGTPFAYFSLLAKVFHPGLDLGKFKEIPSAPFTLCRNGGGALSMADVASARSFFLLHGSWGRPVAQVLEGKMVESGLATACVCDFRNYCHGRFIHTSNHLEDSVVVMLVSPREKDIVERTRGFLPAGTKLVLIETAEDAPEASLDLLIRATEFFMELCPAAGVDPDSPSNPGRIDKRKPMWVPFKAELKRNGPLTL